MGRKPRIIQPGGFYHVVSRGNNRGRIVFDEIDEEAWVTLFGRIALRSGWTVVAYCLMPNHFHFMAQVSDAGLSQGMSELNGGYARRTNQRHGRQDHLFRNRFWCRLIKDDSDLITGCRYIVLNPFRAGLCAKPEDWKRSSYRACAGLENAPRFLAVGVLMELFGPNPEQAARAYRSFVSEGLVRVPGTVTEV